MDDEHDLRVDERGYLLTAVEAWARHGIYPPPLPGDASNPKTVARFKEARARWAAMSEEERAAHHQSAQAFLAEWDREHGWVDGTRLLELQSAARSSLPPHLPPLPGDA